MYICTVLAVPDDGSYKPGAAGCLRFYPNVCSKVAFTIRPYIHVEGNYHPACKFLFNGMFTKFYKFLLATRCSTRAGAYTIIKVFYDALHLLGAFDLQKSGAQKHEF